MDQHKQESIVSVTVATDIGTTVTDGNVVLLTVNDRILVLLSTLRM